MKLQCLAAAICAAPLLAQAQTSISVSSCADLPSEISQDTVLELTTPEVSCPTNTPIEVNGGASLEMTSAEASTKLNNVKIWVRDGTFLCTVPMLDWTSVETVEEIDDDYISEVAGGAAVRTEEETTTTFTEDVTFSGCSIANIFVGGNEAAAIQNYGTMVFQGNTVVKDTPKARRAFYTAGAVTFEKDATFENNNRNGDDDADNGIGGAMRIGFDGTATFKGATYFLNNEAVERDGYGYVGAALHSNSFASTPMVFTGPVTVSGNSGSRSALSFTGGQSVIFESLVTFTDNIMAPKLYGDSSKGGAMYTAVSVEFRGGVTATGNTAKEGGVFYVDSETELAMSGPVTITGNEARYAGGAIYNKGKVTIPAAADISGNTAIFCPGVNLVESYYDGWGEVVIEGGKTYEAGTKELCYLGGAAADSPPVDIAEEFDCNGYSASAPMSNEHPYLVLDTAAVKSWDFGSKGFSCDTQLVVYVTGGEELTVTSTAAASTVANVHFEVIGYTSLVLDVPDLTMTGIYQSQVGGAVFVDVGSSLDVMNEITFLGNSLAIEYDLGLWAARGGAAVYSAGTTTFHGKAYFLGNGQYDADQYEPDKPYNEDGGALSNSGTMTFMQKGTFIDNFNPNGGNGGAIANFGDITFALRGVFRNNSVGVAYNGDGQPEGGRGGAVYNGGESSTILFSRLAVFKDNVGALGGGALASRGFVVREFDDDLSEGDSRVTFAGKAKFKDNSLDGDYPSIYDDDRFADWIDENKGGGAILAYGATTIEFADTAVFKRNEATDGGSISNNALLTFVSEEKLVTADNVAIETCPDILNNVDGTVVIGTEAISGPDASLCERPAAAPASAAPAA